MGRLFDDHLAAAAVVGQQSREIGHRAGGNEQRIVLACQFSRDRFELVDGRIIAAPGVAQRRGCDRRHHLRRRQRHAVASEIVHLQRAAREFSPPQVSRDWFPR